jgi:tRNA (adenine22-N1)-methyltransferase
MAPLRLPKLDARLSAASSLVPQCALAADIGADHGRLSCYLLGRDICQSMIVSDISEVSLKKAMQLLQKHGLRERAHFVVADGLHAVQEPVDAVIITGLGGQSIADMLTHSVHLGQASLILSAQTQTELLRTRLMQTGYAIAQELVVNADDRYYTVMLAQRLQVSYSARELFIGPTLRGTHSAKVSNYLDWRIKVLAGTHDCESMQMKWLKEEIECAMRDEQSHL